jgi:hypothetical protein
MARSRKNAVRDYRRRLRRKGAVRLEVHVRKEDAPLVRGIVRALSDPSQETETRIALRERFGKGQARGLKALLASAPLEEIDLTRERDMGRDIDL